jgi:hypothetical protein
MPIVKSRSGGLLPAAPAPVDLRYVRMVPPDKGPFAVPRNRFGKRQSAAADRTLTMQDYIAVWQRRLREAGGLARPLASAPLAAAARRTPIAPAAEPSQGAVPLPLLGW